ncbi:MAG: TonB-dependent receptor [Calditrichia bacterium]
MMHSVNGKYGSPESGIRRRRWRSLMFLFLFIPALIFSQSKTGKLIGTVVDGASGEALIGANVYFENTAIGAATDLDGTFIVSDIPAGSYDLMVQMIGYSNLKITGVQISADKTQKLELAMRPETLTAEEVVVEARMIRNNEASLLKERQKAVSVSDAISAEAISRSGSGDAAEAMKKVTGASIVEGKYVYVRGLGERYSSTQLNGAELPTSDPDKKAFQLDLLPSNLLDNIVTVKTFTPDKPGNFSGGLVDVGTKSFPDQFTLKISATSKYNTQSNYNGDYLTYNGGGKDWLGYDDGTRSIPAILKHPKANIPLPVEARFDRDKAQWLDAVSTAFNSTMNVSREAVPFNRSFGFSAGNHIKVRQGSTLGYIGSVTYDRSYSFYENGEVGRYTLNDGADGLNPQLLVSDTRGRAETNLGALASISFNINPMHRIGGNFIYSRSGISTARLQSGSWPQEFGINDETHLYYNRVLSYIERDIQSYQARGEHHLPALLNLTADWSATFSRTSQDEPDRRLITSMVRYFPSDTINIITGSNFDNPSRYFRYLQDRKNIFNLNLTIPFEQWGGLGSRFKVGASYQEGSRDFEERIFTYTLNNKLFNELEGDISGLFDNGNNGIVEVDTLAGDRLKYTFGNTIYDNSKPKNNYDGSELIRAYYAMLDVPLTRRLRFIGGARYESTGMDVVSADETQQKGHLKKEDVLPSLNIVYQLKSNMNLRFAATQTLARPNFRELAPYSTKEFVNDVELRGNPALKRTLIDNYDIRWEWFTRPGEILAVSGFYKDLKNPIELAYDPLSNKSNPILIFTNVPSATIMGAEFEIRMNLDHFLNPLGNFSFGSNLSLIKSKVDIPEGELSKRRDVNPDAPDTRVLQGQSDYLFNIDLTYHNRIGTTAGINYNTFGERLSKVSAVITPDVYEQPAQQLDFNLSQLVYHNLSFKFGIKNILNSAYREVYRFQGEEYVYLKYRRGITYSLGLGYSL